jgi:xylan 1,4-beta-xylosidase
MMKRMAGILGLGLLLSASALAQTRVIAVDATKVKGPRDMAWRKCVGSDHARLLMSAGNQAQLAEVHRELGFEYVRFHGLFTDDMDVYKEVAGKPVYDWTKVDALYDGIVHMGMKPFVELGFMPRALESGTAEVFWYHARVSPPKDMAKWAGLVEAFTRHMEARYGAGEVKTWYFEVWNEPNYIGFWPNTDQKAYFELYDASAAAVKRVNPAYRVGGPATAGAGWVPEFIAHTVGAKAPVDFISTHTYAVSQGFLDADGNADLVLSTDADAIVGDVRTVHQQILASARPELPLEMTEWSASYSSRDPVHDSYTSAAFVLDKLKRTVGLADVMSYWTYSDLFEENGPPPAAFHGGFGLLTRDDLPKATYFAYKYLNELGAAELDGGDSASYVTKTGKGVRVLVWNETPLKQTEGNKAFYRKLHPAAEVAPVELRLSGLAAGKYRVTLHRTGYRANDAYSRYIEMGLPKDLSAEQLAELKATVTDKAESEREVVVGKDGAAKVSVTMRENDLVLVVVERAGSR